MNIQIDKSIVDRITNRGESISEDGCLKEDNKGETITLSVEEYESVKVDMSLREFKSLNDEIKELEAKLDRLHKFIEMVGITNEMIDGIIPKSIFTADDVDITDNCKSHVVRFNFD